MSTQKLMRGHLRLHPLLLACASTWAATGAQAVLLGTVSNSVYIGKPFFAAVPVGDTEDAVGCISAQLSYGESIVGDTTFQLKNHTLKVRSSRPIDEPIVTLTVSADCDNPTTRSYTLFAEMPLINASESKNNKLVVAQEDHSIDTPDTKLANNQNFFGIESSPNTDYIIVQALPGAGGNAKKRDNDTNTRTLAAANASNSTAAPAQLRPNAETSTAAKAQTQSANNPFYLNKGSNAPRLELDNTDLLEKDPQLRVAHDLLSPSSADPKVREEARLRWDALSAQMASSSTAVENSQAQALVAKEEARQLQIRIQHSEQEIARLQLLLAQERNNNGTLRGIVYSLAGLLLLGLIALAYRRWRLHRLQRTDYRSSKELPWWQQYATTGAAPRDTDNFDLPIKNSPANNLTGYAQELPVPEVAFDSEMYSDFPESDESSSPAAPPKKPQKPVNKEAENLQNTQQQADFFVALGQFQQAEHLLRRYIRKNPETSPLVYLNLLGIYYSAKKRPAFDALRTHFNRVFNAHIPDFDHFKSDPRGLDSYPETVARIQQQWGRSEVIRLIEDSLFRHPDGNKAEEAFAPLAYRELLLLYGIATDTSATPEDLSRIKSVAADASKWLQPDTVPVDLDHPTVQDENAEGDSQPDAFANFNTGPGVLDGDDPWRLNASKPPAHMDLDLDLDTTPADIDLHLPEHHYAGDSGPDTINLLGTEDPDDKPRFTHSTLDLSLNDSESSASLQKKKNAGKNR